MHACTRIGGQVRARPTASKPLEAETLRKYNVDGRAILRFRLFLLTILSLQSSCISAPLSFVLFRPLFIFFIGGIFPWSHIGKRRVRSLPGGSFRLSSNRGLIDC